MPDRKAVVRTAASIAAALFIALPGTGMAEEMASLAALRWKQRPLLVFAPQRDARLARQRAIIAAAAGGYDEREIHIVTIIGDAVSGTSDGAATLRRRHHVDPHAFAVILIGKDGGEKLRSAEPLAAGQLFETVDAMPMRKNEMHR